MENYLYFRSADTLAADNGVLVTDAYQTSACIPASSITSMIYVEHDTVPSIRLHFKNVSVESDYSTDRLISGEDNDFVRLKITSATVAEEVIKTLSEAIYNEKGEFIVLGDDVTGEYIDNRITEVTQIQVTNVSRGLGFHSWTEVLSIDVDPADDQVAARLSLKLPANCILLEAGITNLSQSLATNDVGSLALEHHTALQAALDASAGTEFVGADSAGNASIPDADLDVSSNASANRSIHSGTIAPFSNGSNETFFHLVAKEDMSSMTGSPVVTVTIKWYGAAAVRIEA